jgi:hemerythrin
MVMKKFELSNDMLTGIDDIDKQHRKLLSWGNTLFSDDTDEAAVKKAEQALGNLTRYVSYHFLAEEEAMHRYDYNKLEKHMNQHVSLKLKVGKLANRLKKEGASRALLIELQYQFIDWFVYHIKEWDQPFAAFIKSSDLPFPFSLTEEDKEVDWTTEFD